MNLSIIIPVYNSEKTIKFIGESILKQINNDTELIIIDDGSTDNSAEICDELAIKFPQCRVIHKQNGGVSSARNIGIQNSCGKYLLFVDSDDEINIPILKKMIDFLRNVSFDLVVCNYSYYFINEHKENFTEFQIPKNTELSKEEIIKYIIKPLCISTGTNMAALWHKFFKRSIILNNGISFNEKMHKGEDWEFILKYSVVSENAIYVPENLYKYMIDGSQCETKYKKTYGIHSLDEYKLKIDINNQFSLNASDDLIIKWNDEQIDVVINCAKNKISKAEWEQIINDKSVQSASSIMLKVKNKDYIRLEISRKHFIYAILIKLKLTKLLWILINNWA